MTNSVILGTGHYVPSRILSNRELEAMVDTSDAWITDRTGVRSRRIAATDESASDLASEAAKRALEASGLVATDLDLILIATVTPDMPMPSTAMFVQKKIGARTTCPGFDLSAACAGFIYGLSVADQFIRTGTYRHILVVGVELLSRVVDWKDRATCVLFGDGAGAVVLGPSQDANRGILSTHLYADGNHADLLYIPAGGSRLPASRETLAQGQHFIHMAGSEVFKIAVKNLASASLDALTANGLGTEDVDWVFAHQANIRILEGVSKRANLPMERFYLNLDRFGNTSSASIPIALDEAVRQGKVTPGQRLVCCALGGGLTWGSALIRW